MTIARPWLLAAGVYSAMFMVERASGNPAFVKPLRDLGYPIENCQYCHLDKSPQRERPHAVNSRGRWLWSEKQRRGVRKIDPTWLKDYPGAKEQK
jgi:hypothetical protein